MLKLTKLTSLIQATCSIDGTQMSKSGPTRAAKTNLNFWSLISTNLSSDFCCPAASDVSTTYSVSTVRPLEVENIIPHKH